MDARTLSPLDARNIRTRTIVSVRRTAEEAEATRRQLLATALEVFGERGYAATRLEDVAARAGVTRGAVYHHFRDKAALYAETLAEAWRTVTAPVFAHLSGDGPALRRLERFLVAYCAALEQDRRFKALLSLTTAPVDGPAAEAGLADKQRALRAWLDQITALLEEAAAGGELRDEVTPSEAARVVLCFLNGVTTTVLVTDGLISPASESPRLVAAVLRGIRR